jgi:hypothetical protein
MGRTASLCALPNWFSGFTSLGRLTDARVAHEVPSRRSGPPAIRNLHSFRRNLGRDTDHKTVADTRPLPQIDLDPLPGSLLDSHCTLLP